MVTSTVSSWIANSATSPLCPVLAGIPKRFALRAALHYFPRLSFLREVFRRRPIRSILGMVMTGKQSDRTRPCHSVICSAANLAFTDPGSNPGHRGERLVKYRLNRGPVLEARSRFLMYINSVPTSQQTHCIFITNTDHLITRKVLRPVT